MIIKLTVKRLFVFVSSCFFVTAIIANLADLSGDQATDLFIGLLAVTGLAYMLYASAQGNRKY